MYGKCFAVLVVLSLLSQLAVGAISIGDITTEPMEPIVPKTSLGLPLADIPEVLTAEQTVQAHNVERLRDEEETQNLAVFRNADGTNTLYLFSENIWYEDANGEKHDYNTKLTQGAQTGTYTSANAGGNLVLPQSVSADTPISYTENGYTVTMYPINERIGTGAEIMGGEGESRIAVPMAEEETARIHAINEAAAQAAGKTINTATLDAKANTVEYFRANADATIIASTLLHGVKNDLLMASDNNVREYSFIVDTDGLTPVQSGETSIALVDDEGQLQGYINVEEIMDANGNKSFQNKIAFLAKADGTYLVTMTVDEEFIAEAAYPTRAAIIYATANLDGSYINDIDVGTYDPNANYATAAKLYVGNLAGEVYRTYFQLVFADYKMAPYAVNSASMRLYESSANTSTMTIDPKIPNHTWAMSNMCWNHVANQATFHDPYQSGIKEVYPPSAFTVTTSGWYTIPMTQFVQACMRNYINESWSETINELRGFLLMSTAESTQMLHYFSSTNASSNKPYIVLNYNSNYNKGAAKIFHDESRTTVNCLGYAWGITGFIDDELSREISPTETVTSYFANVVAPYLSAMGVEYRTLSNAQQAIDLDEYRVTMRLSEKLYDIYGNYWGRDYHFWVETTDGWAHKAGETQAQLKGNADPDQISNWRIGDSSYYYNTETLYLAKTVEEVYWYDIF